MKGKNTGKWRLTPLIVWLFAWPGLNTSTLGAQSIPANNFGSGRSLADLKSWVFPEKNNLHQAPFPFEQLHPETFQLKSVQNVSPGTLNPLHWEPKDQPIFCRIEHHLDKKVRIPVKFRLGSVEYVDWLEGKPGATYFDH